MQTLPVFRLKKDRDKSARNGHPWLFSGAFQAIPEIEPGSLCRVESSNGRFVAIGYANPKRSLTVRLLAWHEVDDIEGLLRQRIETAFRLRQSCIPEHTNAYRLLFGEGDFLPGLVVDRYDEVLVLQVLTAGIERLRDKIVALLVDMFRPVTLYERSDIPARREEGLPMRKGVLHGAPLPPEIEIQERGLRYGVQPDQGQKTGFFLDQREHRARVGHRTRDRNVLNCFAYTGAFSVAACAGGAQSVTSVESSQPAVRLLQSNLERNGFPIGEVVHGDAIEFLRASSRAGRTFDVIVLDPPAFAKKRHQVDSSLRGYKEINRQAFELLNPDGELFTFSCSRFVDPTLFKKVVFGAATDARVHAQLLDRFGHPPDHPVSLAHPEGEYLKGLHLRRL